MLKLTQSIEIEIQSNHRPSNLIATQTVLRFHWSLTTINRSQIKFQIDNKTQIRLIRYILNQKQISIWFRLRITNWVLICKYPSTRFEICETFSIDCEIVSTIVNSDCIVSILTFSQLFHLIVDQLNSWNQQNVDIKLWFTSESIKKHEKNLTTHWGLFLLD